MRSPISIKPLRYSGLPQRVFPSPGRRSIFTEVPGLASEQAQQVLPQILSPSIHYRKMDIVRFNFPWKLLEILTAVSESHFVSFDLELSGVPVRPYGAAREPGKQTLQQRYAETKAAAEKYTILQIGLTCVKEDAVDGTYELKPFNIQLSPILSERLDIDRNFSFHSGAVEFLNSVGFNFQAPLAIGVPYLSREEARLARERAEGRHSRTKDFYDPLVIKPEETEALALRKTVQKLVQDWLDTGKPHADGIYLGPKELSTSKPPPDELSRYEKRLIHQIVRFDFEDLVTVPRRGLIQVIRLDKEREDAVKRQRIRESKERIYRQTGFRWVIEAIAGRSFSNIDWQSFVQVTEEGHALPLTPDTKSRFQRCQHLLDGRPRPVVGHNMFLDLIYLYQTFIGQLPDKVEDFASRIKEIFPVVIDTKYVATHECGDINPMSSLQQLAEQLDEQEKPVMRTHEDFNKYDEYIAHHEAGYDSLLTAKVAIRLSAKLEVDRRSGEEDGKDAPSSSDDDGQGGVAVGADGQAAESRTMLSSAMETVRNKIVVPVGKTVTAIKSTAKPQKQEQTSRFAHTTAFDGLQGDDTDDAEEDKVLQFDDLPTTTETEDTSTGWSQASNDQDQVWTEQKWVAQRLMPRWSSTFWSEYGNRLRVFGTQESICMLETNGEDSSAKDRDGKGVEW